MNPGPRQIIAFVAERFGITPADITGSCRIRHYVRARQMCMVVLRYRTGVGLTANSYPIIARHLGKKDHTTVLHGLKVFAIHAARDAWLLRTWWEASAYANGYGNLIEGREVDKPRPIMVTVPAPSEPQGKPRNLFSVPIDEEDAGHRFHRNIGVGSAAFLAALQQ